MYKILIFFLLSLLLNHVSAQETRPVRIHYDGGGDWYGNKTTWQNILKKVRTEFGLNTAKDEIAYRITDPEFKQYPIAYIAGHGNISFSDAETELLRNYLVNGGFLFADDDYGMDISFRREMKKVFPELNFVEIPFSHPLYHTYFNFDQGLPKVHEHAGGPPKGFGLFYKNRMVCFYSFNTDISDGCENEEIHHDPASIREQALRMAVNIFIYALLN